MSDENEQQEENGQEGMSTGKKVVAGAAIGVAVPAAVGVAKKLLGNGNDKQGSVRSEATERAKSGAARAKRTATSAAKPASKTASGAARKGAGSAKRAGSKARSTARSAGGSTSRASGRTKEQLYQQAKRLDIEGRSSMTKAQLERAVSRKRS